MTEHQDHGGGNPQGEQNRGDGGGFGMMAMMMACCIAIVLLFLLIPVVGWPVGLTIGTVGLIAMLFVHQRMGHGGHN